jgi:hypothetical protein
MKKSLKIILFAILALVVVGASVFAGIRFANVRLAALGQRTFARQYMQAPNFGPGNNMPFQRGQGKGQNQGQGQWQFQNPGNNNPSQPGQNQNPGNNNPSQPGQDQHQNPGYNMPFRQRQPWNNQQMNPRQFGNQGPFMGKGFGNDRNDGYGRGPMMGGNNRMMDRGRFPFFFLPVLLCGGLFGLIVLVLVIWGVVKLLKRKPQVSSAPLATQPCSNCGKPLEEGWAVCPHCGTPVESKPEDKPADPPQPAEDAN